jgi:nucleoside-diphosphate-sugar epimerase
MNIIITGGNGFLGSNIVRKLISHKHQVLVLSKNSNNLTDILNKINYISTDLSNSHQLETQIDTFTPDVLIHCAWKGGNNYNDVNSLSQYDNIEQGIGLIDMLSRLPKKTKFIGFGSFAEYGLLKTPALETDNEQPINHYGLSKYALKNCSKLLCDRHNIEWGWVRPCYVYGPNDVSTRLIPTVINKLLKNEKIELDNCDKTIDYIFVDDFVNFIYSLVIGNIDGVYNLCSGQQYKLKDIVLEIGSLMVKTNNIRFGEPSVRVLTSPIICGNNDKIKKQSSITQLNDLSIGLQKTINFYKQKI